MLGCLKATGWLTPAFTPRPRRPTPLRCSTDGAFFEFPRRPAGAFLAAVQRVAKHFRHGGVSAKKVHLKTVRLFFGARSRIDAPYVRLRVRIWSFSHGVCLTTTPNRAGINERLPFNESASSQGAADSILATCCRTPPPATKHSKGDAQPAAN